MSPRAATTLDVALGVAAAIESLGIRYFVGGSVASSLQGEPRATNDIDLVLDISPAQVTELVAALGPDYSVDVDALVDAVRRRSCCNAYYLPLFTKIDLFACGTAPFDREELARSTRVRVRGEGEELCVKSPEDTVLRKLSWYRGGGESSTRQWRDVVEVLRVSGAVLDDGYLDRWAAELRVADLLQRARAEAAGPREPAR